MNMTVLFKSAVLGLIALAGLAAMPTAHATPITWNGWTFDYTVGVNNEGLALKNVQYTTHTLLKKVSLPVIDESGSTPGASSGGTCSDRLYLDSNLTPMPWANNATVSQRQFNFAGRLWYEIGIYKKINVAEYFQAYYLSADGLLEMRLYSKNTNCSAFAVTSTAKWRIDVDVDGSANDLMSVYTPSLLTIRNESPTSSAVSVSDIATNNVVNIFSSVNNFNHPDGSEIKSDNFSEFRQFGLLFKANEDIAVPTDSPVPDIYSNAESINGKDVLSWQLASIELVHGLTDFTKWNASGILMVPNWVPNKLADVVVESVDYSRGYFSVTIRNRGIAPTPTGVGVGVGFYVDGVYKTWAATKSMLPGESRIITTLDRPLPYFIPDGNHTITAWVDNINRFPESNETNNTLSKIISLTGPDDTAPYVAINSPVLESGFGSANVSGSTVLLSATALDNVAIKNVAFTLRGFFSSAQTTLSTRRVAPFVFSWDSTSVPEGDYILTATAMDTADNVTSKEIQISVLTPATIKRPDLVVTNVSYANGKFAATVKNIGTADIPAPALMALAYSVDGVYKTWASTLGPLAAGASKNLGTSGATYTIPAGSHVIKAHIDDQNLVMEANETNNTLSQTVTVP
jgi:CARDB/Bacterial Ig domain